MLFHLFFVNYLGSCELELEVFKKVVELMQLGRVELWSSVISMGRHQGYYRLRHCGGQMDKTQINGQ